ncbi:hypothetical protein INS74_24585, partial [Escherichia coli]|nr:hypothetical protein [Escherichia coli]
NPQAIQNNPQPPPNNPQTHQENGASDATDTLYLGIASKPQNLGVTLTTQTTGSFRSFMVELQICNSPTSQPILGLSEISTSY